MMSGEEEVERERRNTYGFPDRKQIAELKSAERPAYTRLIPYAYLTRRHMHECVLVARDNKES